MRVSSTDASTSPHGRVAHREDRSIRRCRGDPARKRTGCGHRQGSRAARDCAARKRWRALSPGAEARSGSREGARRAR
jgi:hypothetical protein